MTRKPKAPVIEPFTIVVAEWEDCYANASSQFNTVEEALASYSPMIRRTVGYYVGENEHAVLLATDDDRVSNAREALGGVMYIPKALIRSPLRVMGGYKMKYK